MDNESGKLKRSLGLRHVVFFGLAFMAPGTVFDTYGVAAFQSNGMIAIGYMIALFVMLFTAYSYAQLVKEFPSAGAAYSFAQKAMNPHLGFLVGWAILLDYMLSPMISALLLGISLTAYFPAVPMFVWIILFVIVITTVNILGIKFAANFNTFIFLLSLVAFVLFVIYAIKFLLNGGGVGTTFSILPFHDKEVQFSGLMGVVPILCFTYLGFDAITALSEETKNPTKTIPKAIFIIPLTGSVLYITATYLLQLVYPDIRSFVDPQSVQYNIFYLIGGIFLKTVFVGTGIFASTISAVASGSSASRIMYAMGRGNVLPKKIFGYISPKFHTPVYNILIVGLVALSALFFNLTAATSLINFGAFFAFAFVNISVISHFYIKKRNRSFKGVIKYLIIPAIGAIFIFSLWLNLGWHSFLLGGIWLMIGFIYLVNQTKMFKRPPEEVFSEASEL
ncbi:APC family permease [Lentibacillus daqui]|uniref:APC family permease n=1 Tax=Lentibacillus daqui TaxID=2911514 RepID=UPI0022B0ABBC|nr:APC family permease [Lentibacillus daqui]